MSIPTIFQCVVLLCDGYGGGTRIEKIQKKNHYFENRRHVVNLRFDGSQAAVGIAMISFWNKKTNTKIGDANSKTQKNNSICKYVNKQEEKKYEKLY